MGGSASARQESRFSCFRTAPPHIRSVLLMETHVALKLRAAMLAVVLIFAQAWPPALAAPARPGELVTGLNETLLSVMRDAETLGYRGRYDRLAPVLSETFNFQVMAGISAGRHWRGLSGEQRGLLVEAFGRMSIGTFAARFDGFSGERFEVVGEEPGPRDTVLVRNKLIKSNGEEIEINYLMKRYNERWRVVDVYLDSIYSELATKRSEYSSVLANEGFEGLIRRIGDKLATLGGK